MINRKNVLASSLLLAFILAGPWNLAAQDQVSMDERVAVLPLWYDEDLSSGQNLSETVQQTIQFMLRYLPNYQLVEEQPYPAGQSGLTDYGETHRLKNIIYGRVNLEGQQFSISLLLYSLEKDQVLTVKQGTIAGALGLFDLADRLSLEILEAYLDRPLVFGSLRFEPEDSSVENYRVFVNGKPAGENLAGIPRFLAGDYQIRVDEVLPDGRTVEAVSRSVSIEEDSQAVITIPKARYADVQVETDGPETAFTLTDEAAGLTYSCQGESRLAVPGGSYTFTVTQPDYQGEPYQTGTVSLEPQVGESYTLEVPTTELGRGFRFTPEAGTPASGSQAAGAPAAGSPAAESAGEAAYEIRLNGELLEGDSIDVLPVQTYDIRIDQTLEGERLPVYEGQLRNGKEENRVVEFPLFETKQGWEEYQRNRKPNLSVVVQALDGAYAQAGLRWEGLHRRLGLGLLGGGYMKDGQAAPTVKGQVQWLPFGGGSTLSPEAGVIIMADLEPEGPFYRVGPQLGLAWNTGNGVVSSIFFENELRYTLGDPLFFNWFFSVGVRLF